MKVKKMTVMAMTAMALVACNSTDLFDEQAMENNTKAEYAANFVKKYPNVDMSKGWDFSTKMPYYGFSSTSSTTRGTAITRGSGEGGFTQTDWYEVDNSTVTWMQQQLVEGNDNRQLGSPFYMSVPAEEFTIVPIFQGQAGAKWDLHVVVGGIDYKVWEKSQDIQIKDLCDLDWHDVKGHPTYQWYSEVHWESLDNTIGDDKMSPSEDNNSGVPNLVSAIRAKGYKFSGLPVGEDMYFYLEITQDGNEYNEQGAMVNHVNDVGTQQSSVKGMMLALECPAPANLSGYETMIIGCEDSDIDSYTSQYVDGDGNVQTKKCGSDWDMNDVVFLVYGKSVPKPVEITNGTSFDVRTTVRYMVEDLGATDDFDFNDIVIDVTDIDIVTPTFTNGVLTSQQVTGHRQEAVIRHLGGTLPFILKIGDTEYAAGGQETFKTSPNTVIPVTGYDMSAHNVSVQVEQQGSTGVYNHVKFPKAGEAPMIIAVDQSQTWMNERQSVPESWFYTVPE